MKNWKNIAAHFITIETHVLQWVPAGGHSHQLAHKLNLEHSELQAIYLVAQTNDKFYAYNLGIN